MKKNFSLFLMCLFAVSTMAQFYVKPGADGGSDTNDGSSWANAFATLGKAHTAASAGNTIYVAQGTFTFTGTLTITKSLTFKGSYDPATNTQNYASKSTVDGGGTVRLIIINAGTGIVSFDGFTFSNGKSTGAGASTTYNSGAAGTISNCAFINNDVAAGSVGGGGLYFAGTPTEPTTIVNCVFYGNKAKYGGAFYAGGTRIIDVINCTIAGNSCVEDGGAGYYGQNAVINIKNSIIWDNKKGESANGLRTVSTPGKVNLDHNIIEGGKGGVAEGEPVNVTVVNDDATDVKQSDPLFVNMATGNLNLQEGSPAINAGSNALIPVGITTDHDGKARVIDTTVDLGAYEFDNTVNSTNSIHAKHSVSVYPNPASNYIKITFNTMNKKIILCDLLGKQLFAKTIGTNEKEMTLDVSNLKRGMYLLSTDHATQKIILK